MVKFKIEKLKGGTFRVSVDDIRKNYAENYGVALGKTERAAMKALIEDLGFELKDYKRITEKLWNNMDKIKQIADEP